MDIYNLFLGISIEGLGVILAIVYFKERAVGKSSKFGFNLKIMAVAVSLILGGAVIILREIL